MTKRYSSNRNNPLSVGVRYRHITGGNTCSTKGQDHVKVINIQINYWSPKKNLIMFVTTNVCKYMLS